MYLVYFPSKTIKASIISDTTNEVDPSISNKDTIDFPKSREVDIHLQNIKLIKIE